MNTKISIDNLLEIVKSGGKVKTGLDVYNKEGTLLLEKDIFVTKTSILEILREKGVNTVPVNTSLDGGLWDSTGQPIDIDNDGFVKMEPQPESKPVVPSLATNEIEMRLIEIEEIQKQASEKYLVAKQSIKKVLTDIKNTGGQFDYNDVEKNVSELVNFLITSDNPFSYLTREMFSFDDYLYNHSINVCAIGTAILTRFNESFSTTIDGLLKNNSNDLYDPFGKSTKGKGNAAFQCYYPDELKDISLGFFLHDIGKIIVPDEILNKEGPLTDKEFIEIKKHSYEYGVSVLEKNQSKNSIIRNIVQYHHAPLYQNEARCYPDDADYSQIPLYTRICKLADIYDAMTSKRCYKEAFNPISVVTQLFRSYAKKDTILQHILHAFVKSIGIYPPGSIIYLQTGQMAYVLESHGPIVLPFTDGQGNPLRRKPDPINLHDIEEESLQRVDNRKNIQTPKKVYSKLPEYIRKIITVQ
jgi:HD-GYP domain-containing protein (c-di-GMP phosphodiesterase class II)